MRLSIYRRPSREISWFLFERASELGYTLLRCTYLLGLLLGVVFVGSSSEAFGQGKSLGWAERWPAQELYLAECGPLQIRNKYGPYDYRRATEDERELVEGAHFDIEYESYQKGQKKSSRPGNQLPVAAGFHYTLWAFPNHPQALAAVEDLGIRYKSETLPGSGLRVHCFFQRAVRFVPDDALVRALYGYYYARRGKSAEANAQLEKAESLGVASANVSVYSAFAYFELQEYEKSLVAAKRAYQLGYSLPGLRNRLERAGKWRD